MPSADAPFAPEPAGTGPARVVAVVPTFHPDTEVPLHVRTLSNQVDRVFVVDDGSGPGAQALLDSLESNSVAVLRLTDNSGIAAALNAGVKAALADGADYVVNIDQDTELPAGYVQACLETFATANPVTRLGVVCADAVNGAPSIPSLWSPEGLGLVPEAIQSGFVISRECLLRGGLFDERLVIDCVDTEYCVRIREHGFRIAVASGTDIRHSLGEMVPYRPFGRQVERDSQPVLYQYHSPFRQYYITRNNIDLVLRFARSQPRWTLAVIKRQIRPTIDAMISGPMRSRQVVAVVVGAVHGLTRRRGKIPARLHRFLTR